MTCVSVLDVQPAGRHVGGDEQVGGPAAQPRHHPVALLLAHAAVQRLGAVAAAVERLGELVDLLPGAAEDDRGRGRLHVEDPPERGRLVRPRDTYALWRTSGASPGAGVVAAELDLDRVAQVAAGDARRCAAASSPRTAPSAVPRRSPSRIASMSSANPMSSISSASSSTTVSTAPQPQRPATQVVQGAPRGGDHDVDAALERPQLAADRLPAVDRQDPHAQLPAVAVERLRDLHGQLPGGHQHQRRPGPGHRDRRSTVAGSAARTPPSCRCRWRPARAGRGRRSSGGMASRWIGVGSS